MITNRIIVPLEFENHRLILWHLREDSIKCLPLVDQKIYFIQYQKLTKSTIARESDWVVNYLEGSFEFFGIKLSLKFSVSCIKVSPIKLSPQG